MRTFKSLVAVGLALPGWSYAQLPGGATVAAGTVSISQNGQNQVIDQSTSKAIVDWQSFSIGTGYSVRFNQPNSASIILNRVNGGNPTSILGNLSANGQVFLVNPFGVYFGAGASVDVGGLLATTMNISNDDFMAGKLTFRRDDPWTQRREVINAGVLRARDGGYVVLAGDYASNSGVIQARLGTVALASGSKMTLDIAGDNLINFTVNEKTVAELSGVANSGALLADGGRAIMTASVANQLAGAAVNNSGVVQARSAEERDGAIYLSADGGNTLVSGTLDASGQAAGQKGGSIDVLGNKVALVDAARLDASGDAGGGNVRIGGAFQGRGPQPNASTAYVGKDALIKADALNNGNGGNVVVWSNDLTRYYGRISARGGAQGGDGGNVEVSGKAVLDYNGSVDTMAPKGRAGTLLLDPSDIEILQTVDPATADMTGTSPFADATNNGGTSRMTVAALENALANGNVTVTTTSNGAAPKGGTITIDDGNGGGVQWSSGNTLHLQAANTIQINSTVEGYNGTLWLDAANGAAQKAGTVIGANSLLLTGGGNWDLGGVGGGSTLNSFNKVGTLAADINGGLLRFSSDRSFTVGSVNGVNGINHTNGNTQLYIDRNNGVLTLAQDINSGSIYLRASGGTNQTGGSIRATSLSVAGGSASLTRSGNNVANLSASVNGDFSYTDADWLTIESVFGVNGITTNNHNVTLTTGDAGGFDPTKLPDGTNPASLTLNESINAGGGTVRLTAGTGGVYQRHDKDTDAGKITAGSLLLQGSSASKVTPFILTNANNLVGTLAGSANGSINYAGGPLTVGTVGGISGLATTADTIVVPAGTDSNGNATPAIYNDNTISLAVGGNLNINQNINAKTDTGSGAVSITMGGDFTAATAAGKRIDANTLAVFGDSQQGTFNLTTNVAALAAGGGKTMVIDNSAYTGELAAIGIGAQSSNTTVSDDGKSATVNNIGGSGGGTNITSSNGSTTVTGVERPVGDFYLTTGGGLNITKLISTGNNLMLRSNGLSILLDAKTADGARIMLQPYTLNSRLGIHNSTDADFSPDVNYDADTLLKFSNPTATFFFGTPQNAIMWDPAVPSAAKNIFTGDIHLGADGDFNLGYRSLSAQTSGDILAHNIGPLYNLRLQAPNLTIESFQTFGNQIHLFSNNLSLTGTADKYINPNKPEITYRTLNDETIWVGSYYGTPAHSEEKLISSDTILKFPAGSTIIISGSTDYQYPNGGRGYHDIWMVWNGGSIGDRKLILSTGDGDVKGWGCPSALVPNCTVITSGSTAGKSGGLWQGCQSLSSCQASNPSPFPDPTPTDNGNGGGGSGNDDDSGKDSGSSDCKGCPPAPPNENPYPPDTKPTDTVIDPGEVDESTEPPGSEPPDPGETPIDNITDIDPGEVDESTENPVKEPPDPGETPIDNITDIDPGEVDESTENPVKEPPDPGETPIDNITDIDPGEVDESTVDPGKEPPDPGETPIDNITVIDPGEVDESTVDPGNETPDPGEISNDNITDIDPGEVDESTVDPGNEMPDPGQTSTENGGDNGAATDGGGDDGDGGNGTGIDSGNGGEGTGGGDDGAATDGGGDGNGADSGTDNGSGTDAGNDNDAGTDGGNGGNDMGGGDGGASTDGGGDGGGGAGDGSDAGGIDTGNGTDAGNGGDGTGGGDGGAATDGGGDGAGGGNGGTATDGNGAGDGADTGNDGGAGTDGGNGGAGADGGDGGAATDGGGTGEASANGAGGGADTSNGNGNGAGTDIGNGGDGGAGADGGGNGAGTDTGSRDGTDNGDDAGGGDGGAATDSGGDGNANGAGGQGGTDGDGSRTGTGVPGTPDGDGGASTDGGGSDGGRSGGASDDGGDGQRQPGSSGTPVTAISCDSVTAAKNEKDKTVRTASSRLVEISRNGVKLPDPCQKQPEQGK